MCGQDVQQRHYEQLGDEGRALVCAPAMAILPDCCRGICAQLGIPREFGEVSGTAVLTDPEV